MLIYIIRHGQDDDSVRGGWSNCSLTDIGIEQSRALAEFLQSNKDEYNIGKIVSSDLNRAFQTAEIIGDYLNIEVETGAKFREVNNGDLAGMKNELVDKLYPNLYWKNLDWTQKYPNGESPQEFYERISAAWNALKNKYVNFDKNILLVTHGGVINIIKVIERNTIYSNKESHSKISCCKIDCAFDIFKEGLTYE